MFVGDHLAQAGQIEGRKVVDASRLPIVHVGTAPAEARQVAVRGPDWQVHQQGDQGIEVVPLRFAGGREASMVGNTSRDGVSDTPTP